MIQQPCATCPWLRANQRTKHPANWYTIANLRRLWNGLRTGQAPGMVCHATDPESIHYGGDKGIKAGVKRECIGANTLLQREINVCEKYRDFHQYRRERPLGFTRTGLAVLVERILFGPAFNNAPPCGDVNNEEITLPFSVERK